jgi:SEC-C motif-containing protein
MSFTFRHLANQPGKVFRLTTEASDEMTDSTARVPDTDQACPCGSGVSYGRCCAPILAGEQPAATAEALMRSRYSAYVVGQLRYLLDSLHPEHRDDMDLAATRRWAQDAQWLQLQVLDTEDGGEQDDNGIVEFVATYKEKNVVRPHRERANFRRHDGVWYYVDGEILKPATEVHAAKVGRNDPCPCGSGKKYKKCCGR